MKVKYIVLSLDTERKGNTSPLSFVGQRLAL